MENSYVPPSKAVHAFLQIALPCAVGMSMVVLASTRTVSQYIEDMVDYSNKEEMELVEP